MLLPSPLLQNEWCNSRSNDRRSLTLCPPKYSPERYFAAATAASKLISLTAASNAAPTAHCHEKSIPLHHSITTTPPTYATIPRLWIINIRNVIAVPAQPSNQLKG